MGSKLGAQHIYISKKLMDKGDGPLPYGEESAIYLQDQGTHYQAASYSSVKLTWQILNWTMDTV